MVFFLGTAGSAVFALPAALPVNDLVVRGSCDWKACAAALGPTAVSCLSAADKGGLDPWGDGSCITGIINIQQNVPTSCVPCAAAAKSSVQVAEHKVANKTKKIGGEVEHFFGRVF